MDNPLFRPLEDLVNRGIRVSPEAQSLCRALAGRRLKIDPTGLPGSLLIAAEEDGLVFLIGQREEPADCVVRGLPISLVRAAMSGTSEALRQGASEMTGDPAVAQDFRRVLDLARPDWEEELSRVFGDVIAHQFGNLARGVVEWGRRSADTLAMDSGEFLTEESRQLPTRYEIEEFLDEVDRLRDDVERCEARLDRIAGDRGRHR